MKRTELAFLGFLALPLAAFTFNPALLGEVTEAECNGRCKSNVYDPKTNFPEWAVSYDEIVHVKRGKCSWVAGTQEPPTPAKCNETDDCQSTVKCTVTMDEVWPLSYSMSHNGNLLIDNDKDTVCSNFKEFDFAIAGCGDTDWELIKLHPDDCMQPNSPASEIKKIGLYCFDCPKGYLN